MVCTLFDTQMKLYNGITYKEIAAMDHINSIQMGSKVLGNLVIYKEEQIKDNA